MSLAPTDWSVVTLGRWNRAILTPAGIRQRVFRLPPDGPVEVLVPIDLLAPPQVNLEDMTVVANWDRLFVRPKEVCSFDLLDRARQLTVNTMESLPETPLTAVGYNVVYRSHEPVEELRNVLHSDVDESFLDHDYTFGGRTLARVIPWREGAINLSIEEDSQQEIYTVSFNFERKSVDRNHQIAWLQVPIEEARQQVHRVLTVVLGIAEESIHDVGNIPVNNGQ